MKYITNKDKMFSHAFKYSVYVVDELGYPIKECGGFAYFTPEEAHKAAKRKNKEGLRVRVFEEIGYSYCSLEN